MLFSLFQVAVRILATKNSFTNFNYYWIIKIVVFSIGLQNLNLKEFLNSICGNVILEFSFIKLTGQGLPPTSSLICNTSTVPVVPSKRFI